MVQFYDTPHENIIELHHIKQSYDGGKTFIIEDLSMLVEKPSERGRLVVILGMSGCGKSTLFRYVAGLQKPTAGTVILKGKPVGRDNRASMVFQQYSSLPWLSVLDNVALGLEFKGVPKKERREQAAEMIKAVGLAGHENKYAQYPSLSGGQLQRVAIARSLLANPEVLLMDEPFGALDISTRLQMQDLLLSLMESIKPTILFVTHDIEEAVYLAEDIYMMRAFPGQFADHVKVDIAAPRNRDTKRSTHFVQLVNEVEDRMLKVIETYGKK